MKFWHWLIYSAIIAGAVAAFSIFYCRDLTAERDEVMAYCGGPSSEGQVCYADSLLQIAGRLEEIKVVAEIYGYTDETSSIADIHAARSNGAAELFSLYDSMMESENDIRGYMRGRTNITSVHKKTIADKQSEIMTWAQTVLNNPYNDRASGFNHRLETFPAFIYAKMLKIEPFEYFG